MLVTGLWWGFYSFHSTSCPGSVTPPTSYTVVFHIALSPGSPPPLRLCTRFANFMFKQILRITYRRGRAYRRGYVDYMYMYMLCTSYFQVHCAPPIFRLECLSESWSLSLPVSHVSQCSVGILYMSNITFFYINALH